MGLIKMTQEKLDALITAINNRAKSADVYTKTQVDNSLATKAASSHVGATGTAHGAATTSVNGFMSSTDKTKLDGIAAGAQANQNSFSNIAVSGQTTVAADSATDTLTLVAGTNVTIVTNATTETITISANDTSIAFTEITGKPTTLSGYGITDAAASSHVGATGTAHGAATTSANGFMSSTDKTKLDGIAAGAQVNTVASVAGKTGAVTLAKADVGLGSVDNTSDASKPISTAAQTALNLKADKATTLAGYGITDAAAQKGTATVYGGAKFSLSGTTLTITTT